MAATVHYYAPIIPDIAVKSFLVSPSSFHPIFVWQLKAKAFKGDVSVALSVDVLTKCKLCIVDHPAVSSDSKAACLAI